MMIKTFEKGGAFLKRICTVLLAAVLLFLPVKAAGSVYTWGCLQYTVDNEAVTIVGYFGTDEHVQVPPELGGYPVSVIAAGAFAGTHAKTVVLPDCVEYIAPGAFDGVSYSYGDTLISNGGEEGFEPIVEVGQLVTPTPEGATPTPTPAATATPAPTATPTASSETEESELEDDFFTEEAPEAFEAELEDENEVEPVPLIETPQNDSSTETTETKAAEKNSAAGWIAGGCAVVAAAVAGIAVSKKKRS